MKFDNLRQEMELGFLNDHAQQHPIDHGDLLLRGTLIEDLQAVGDLREFMERMLHPMLNTVWSAAGFRAFLN